MQTEQFDGKTYDPVLDKDRLSKQMQAVIDYMSDGSWRTLSVIAQHCDIPPQSASARLRDLRKERYGSQTIERKRIVQGVYAYRWVKDAA